MSEKLFFTFNGLASTEAAWGIENIINVTRELLPSTKDNTMEVAGRDGLFDFGALYMRRDIEVQFLVAGNTREQLRTRADAIARWFETRQAAPLIFSDEPDYRYMARHTGPVSKQQIVNTGQCRAVFMVPDAYKEEIDPLTVTDLGVNSGGIPTDAVITAEIQESTSSFQVTLAQGNFFILLLQTLDIGDTVVIDTRRRLTTVNGFDARAAVHIDSRYFKLPVGGFNLETIPASTTLQTVYRQRFR